MKMEMKRRIEEKEELNEKVEWRLVEVEKEKKALEQALRNFQKKYKKNERENKD